MKRLKKFIPDNLQSKDKGVKMNKSIITVGELAEMLGVAPGTIYNRLRFGDLPFSSTDHFFGQGRRTRKGERILFDCNAVSCWRKAYAKKWKS